MEFISNSSAEGVITEESAYRAVHGALLAVTEDAALPPVVITRGIRAEESFSVKCASCAASHLVGFKVGGYWPRNAEAGMPRHSTSIVLIDPDTGRFASMIRGDRLNGFRTAASNAIATDALARSEAATLSIFGSGHQAEFEVRAICRIRPIQRIMISSRNQQTAAALRSRLASYAESVQLANAQPACKQADIIVTVTPSCEPLFEDAWIRPGTHISAMGADKRGKRELPLELLRRSSLFADYRDQSLQIGEFQHVRDLLLGGEVVIENIGDVLRREVPGRRSNEEITIYDSSGLALQDLYVAAEVLRLAREAGLVQQIHETP
jgi:ornithine cyclodeaminase